MTREEAIARHEEALEREEAKEIEDSRDLEKINESRDRDYEEIEEEIECERNDELSDYDEELQEGVEDLEEGLGWIEAGSSAIGGGIPVMEGASLDDAIRDAVESEFSAEELSEEAPGAVNEYETKTQGLFENTMESSGPEFKPKGGKK